MTAGRRPIRAAAVRWRLFRPPACPRAGAEAAGLSGARRDRSLRAAALLAALLPVGCGEGRDQKRLAALEAGIASAQASLSVFPASSSASPPARNAAPDAAPFDAPARMAAAPLPAGSRPVAASALLGAGPDALRRWFGDPDLRRPEGSAEVRLYVGPGCALDVVLYAEGPGEGGMRVKHAVARADGAAAVTEAECLRGIADAGGGGVGRTVAVRHNPGR